MYEKENYKIPDKNMADEVLGNDFYKDLYEMKDDIQLARTPLCYENRCVLAKEVLAKHGFLLKLFEKRHKFRYQIKKAVGKNTEKREAMFYKNLVDMIG